MVNPEKMPQVMLVAKTDVPLEQLASFAALTCTKAELHQIGETIPISGLFNSGHHTTLENNYYTFSVEGLPIGSAIDFGLHLVTPYYNTGQRSGRYCQAMFDNLPRELISQQLRTLYGVSDKDIADILDYLEFCIGAFKRHTPKAEGICADFLTEERPFAKEGYVENNAGKVSQEQLRNLIPVIFPTALAFTVDFITAVSLYVAAWNPHMEYITDKMVELIWQSEPESEQKQKIWKRLQGFERRPWAPKLSQEQIFLDYSPVGDLRGINFPEGVEFIPPRKEDVNVLDLLPIHPEYMDNSTINIQAGMKISLAAFGQDQRHRSIRRSRPAFTNSFYVPPIMDRVGMTDDIHEVMERWNDLSKRLPESLAAAIAPYGAMVSYVKSGDVNAFIHEEVRRLCWCAHEEMHCANVQIRGDLRDLSETDPRLVPIVEAFSPPCWEKGICPESIRQCGRDRSEDLRMSEEYFSKRRSV